MNILIAIDSFKGSLTSLEAGEATAQGIRRAFPDAVCHVRPLADGGEGTVDALTAGLGGTVRTVKVTGPCRRPVEAHYGILPGHIAVMEMAQAAGLPQAPSEARDPMHTTTFGVGEMILDAIAHGCREFIMGIGGSATNDGGVGMLSALGWRFLDARGEPVAAGAAGLADLHTIEDSSVPALLGECRFHVACDVTNPLCGERGCSAVYGPQKGARPQEIPLMDGWMADYARLTADRFPARAAAGVCDPDYPGAGAAGGMGFALRAYLGAELTPGVGLILDKTEMERHIADADIVVTGEGRLDGQTAMGKAPAGVAALAKRHQKPVIAFSGCLGDNASACHSCGIDAFFPILPACLSVEDAMEPNRAARNLSNTAEQTFRLIHTFLSKNDKKPIDETGEKR